MALVFENVEESSTSKNYSPVIPLSVVVKSFKNL